MAPESTYVVFILVYALVDTVRLYIMKGLLGFPPMMFVKEVIMKKILVPAVAAILPSLIGSVMNPGMGRFSVTLMVSVLGSMLAIFYLGPSTH